MKTLLLLVVLILSASAPAVAADAVDLISGEFNAASRKERREIAQSFLKKIEKLSAFIPQSPPSETAWVVREKSEIDKITDEAAKHARLRRYYQTPEFHQTKLKSHLESARDALLCVTDANVSIRRETLCWATASSILLEQSVVHDSILVLLQHGRLPQDIAEKAELLPENLGYGTFYAWYSRGIIEHIVIPYLAGQIKE